MGTWADDAKQALAEAIGSAADVVRLSRDMRGKLANLLLVEQLNLAGLDIESGQQLTPRAIADALNRKFFNEYGIDVGDLLDSESVKRATKKEALRVVGERLGVQGGVADIARVLKARVYADLVAAARAGDDEILQAIGVSERAIAEAERAAQSNIERQQIRDGSEAGQKNRDRQARYRANHKRVWVLK